jgi:hypothetical protein
LPIGAVAGVVSVVLVAAACAQDEPSPPAKNAWRGVHLMAPSPDNLPLLKRAVTEAFPSLGINVLVFEINYNFQFESHPEVRGGGGWTRAQARELAEACRAAGVRLIPQLNCLGHQSWARETGPLLKAHPEFDETPEVPPDNKGIYCRSWCPLHPEVNKVVFALIDELIDAFGADAFHVGMDEVFLIGSDQCARCKGKDPAELFAKAVNDLHEHIVKQRNCLMLMWGDRLLDAAETGYGKWEAAENGTAPAIDLIPEDIIICDWHYEPLEKYAGKPDRYRSIEIFLNKGFRLWPASWRTEEAALAFLDEAQRADHPRMIGYLATTWGNAPGICRALLGEGDPAKSERVRPVVESMRACLEKARKP